MNLRAGLRRFFARPSAVIGSTLVACALLGAAVGPMLVSGDPNLSDFTSGVGQLGMPQPPCMAHWLGTDTLYRDVAARLVVGARASLAVGIVAAAVCGLLGTIVGLFCGLFAGTRYGQLDSLIMRLVDAALAFPFILLVMALGAVLDRPGSLSTALVLGCTGWLGTSRLVRAKTMQVKQLPYVQASVALGCSRTRLVIHHILPNILGPIIVVSTASVATMILSESVLSYLGASGGVPEPSWGRMLHEGQSFMLSAPSLVAFPALCIVLVALGFNLLGEGLRDALDPRS